jgi:predicted Zn-dependent protease
MANEDSKTPDSSVLPLPPWKQRLRPQYVLKLIDSWFFSRIPSRFLLGLPSAIVAVGGICFLLYLKHNDQQAAVLRYEKAVTQALRNEEWSDALLFLNSLSSLRPHVPEYRFHIGLLNQQTGNTAKAVGLMRQLAPLNSEGFAPARMWLVKQAMSGEVQGLTKEEVGQQLKAAVRERPFDPQANQLLADYYVSTQQFRLAEQHLKQAAEQTPELNLALARLQKRMQRGPDEIHATLDLARQAFQKRLTRNAQDHDARIQWAQCHALENQYNEAAQILNEGASRENAAELRVALSQLYAEFAVTRLRESPLNGAMAGQLLSQSISVAPENVAAIAELAKISAAKFQIKPDDLDGAIKYWEEKSKGNDTNNASARLIFAQLLRMCGRTSEAIQQLETGIAEHPESRLLLAQLYAEAKRESDADDLYDQILIDLEKRQDQTVTQSVMAKAVLLLQAQRLDEAISFIKNRRDDVPEADREPLDQIHARVLIVLIDKLLDSDEDRSDEAFALFTEAVSLFPKQQETLVRIAKVSCSKLSAAGQSDALLTKLLAEGDFNATVYNFIGTESLRVGQFKKAQKNLEIARQLDPENPMILNNLALALVRSEDPNHEYSLTLANSVLSVLPDHPDGLSTRAEVYLAMGRLNEANRDLQVALPNRKSSANVRELLISVNERLGNKDLAEQHRQILEQLTSTDR